MFGDHFDYIPLRFSDTIEKLQELIDTNDKVDEFGYKRNYSKETLEVIEECRSLFERGVILLHRIDWLVSDDDGEDCFHRRIKEDLETLKQKENE